MLIGTFIVLPFRGGFPFDKHNFVLLAKELKESLGPHNLLLTSAFGPTKWIIDKAYEVPTLFEYFDFMFVMCYDYGGAWDKRITPNAPLKSHSNLNVVFTIDYLIKLGAPPSKLVLGLPFYGRTFVTNRNGNFGDPINNSAFHGLYTRDSKAMNYNEICLLLLNNASCWTQSFNTEFSEVIAKCRDQQKEETRVIVFDNSRSIAEKMKFAMSRNLAGAMVWSIDKDDFHGDCGIDQEHANYPLLRMINDAMVHSRISNDTEDDPKNEPFKYSNSSATCIKLNLIFMLVFKLFTLKIILKA